MDKEIKIWYDKEGDYLEVIFERKAGYFRETENDAVMEKVDEQGNTIGFSILKVSALKEQESRDGGWDFSARVPAARGRRRMRSDDRCVEPTDTCRSCPEGWGKQPSAIRE